MSSLGTGQVQVSPTCAGMLLSNVNDDISSLGEGKVSVEVWNTAPNGPGSQLSSRIPSWQQWICWESQQIISRKAGTLSGHLHLDVRKKLFSNLPTSIINPNMAAFTHTPCKPKLIQANLSQIQANLSSYAQGVGKQVSSNIWGVLAHHAHGVFPDRGTPLHSKF